MNIEYVIKRSSRRKKLTITVERDRSIIVHAPEHTSDEKIEQVVTSKRQWIYEKIGHPQKYQNAPHAPGKELVNGESLLYMGRQYQVEIVNDANSEVRFDQKFYLPAKNDSISTRAELLKQWYIKRAEEKITPIVKRRAKDLGVEVNLIKIVDNRYRWGSCTVNNNVNINWRLIKAPTFVIDYVILHELAHLIESNHGPLFWNIIKAQTPTMDKAKKWLKDNGQLIEEEL